MPHTRLSPEGYIWTASLAVLRARASAEVCIRASVVMYMLAVLQQAIYICASEHLGCIHSYKHLEVSSNCCAVLHICSASGSCTV